MNNIKNYVKANEKTIRAIGECAKLIGVAGTAIVSICDLVTHDETVQKFFTNISNSFTKS